MRKDEDGNDCPGTLEEYRDLCKAIGIPNNAAVQLLDKKIAESTVPNDEVIAADSQMRGLLMPLLFKTER